MNADLLDIRHQIATVAGNIAATSAQVSRALAWESSPDRLVSFCSDLEMATKSLATAQRQLHECIALARALKDNG